MKHISKLLTASIFILSIFSCTVTNEGPPGPRGPQGPAGFDGEEFVAFAYEYSNVTFGPANGYSLFLEFPVADLPFIFPSDVVLVYQLVGFDDIDQEDVWEALPRTLFNEFGTFIYAYDFTSVSARVFLDANFNLDLLPLNDTDNLIFRVVIIPAEATGRTALDVENYNEVMDFYDIAEGDVVSVK